MMPRSASWLPVKRSRALDTDEGQKDALIAEGGLPGEEQGYAFGYLYDEDGIEREVVYIGPAPNFMENLKLELEVEGTLDPKEQEEATEE